MDERVAKDAVVTGVIEGHVRDGAVVDGHGWPGMLPGQVYGGLRDFNARDIHALVPEHLCIAAIADAGYQYIAQGLRCKQVAGQHRRMGRRHAPHFLLVLEIGFPEFGFLQIIRHDHPLKQAYSWPSIVQLPARHSASKSTSRSARVMLCNRAFSSASASLRAPSSALSTARATAQAGLASSPPI